MEVKFRRLTASEAPQQFRPLSASEEFDRLPWYGKAAQAADDTVRFLANGITLGYADKIAGNLPGGGSPEAQAAATQAARDRAGRAGTAAEFVGTMLPAGALARSSLSATRLVPQSLTGMKGLSARSLAAGSDAGMLGAVQAAGQGQDPLTGYAVGLGAGALGNVAGEGITAGASKALGMFNKPVPTMTAEELKAAGSKAFDEAMASDVIYKNDAVKKLRDTAQNEAAEFGYDEILHPGATAVLKRLDRFSDGGDVHIKGLNTVRKVAQRAHVRDNPENNELVRRLAQEIDDFGANAGPDDVLMGNPQAAAYALRRGRDYWSRFRKIEKVDDVLDRAGRRAAVSGTGGNTQNATKQELNKLLNDQKFMRGFKPAEKEALRRAALPSAGEQAMRLASGFDPSKGVLRAIFGTAMTPVVGPHVMLPLMAGGYLARKAGEKMASRNAELVKRLIAAGGSKSALTGPKNSLQRLTESQRDTIVNALVSGGLVSARER
jgi:hypothetical protein